MTCHYVIGFLPDLKHLPLRIQTEKKRNIGSHRHIFHILIFIKSGQKPWLPGILETCISYLLA